MKGQVLLFGLCGMCKSTGNLYVVIASSLYPLDARLYALCLLDCVMSNLFGGLLQVDSSSAALVGFETRLGSLLDGGLALDNLLALCQYVRPVLEHREGNVLACTVVDQIVAFLCEQ